MSIAEFSEVKELHSLRCSSRQLASLLHSKFYRVAANITITHRGQRKSPLFWASAQGKLSTVQNLLAAGADATNVIDGLSAFHCAAQNGHADITWLLIQAGADPAQPTGTGYAPLVLAAEHGHLEVVRLLVGVINMESHLNHRNFKRALCQSIYFGHTRVVRFMLDVAKKPRTGDVVWLGIDDDEDLMYQAARAGNCDMIHLLLDYGAVIPPVHRRSRHPLLVAAQNGHKEAVQVLMSVGTGRLSAVGPPVRSSQSRPDQILQKYGNDLSGPTKDGRTPLQVALEEFSSPDVIHQLLDLGADVKVKGRAGSTALHTLVQLKRHDLIETFLSAGALLSATDDKGNTPLILAAKLSNATAAALFIQYEADIEAKDNHGRTATHIAASHDNAKLIDMLLGAGADLSAMDDDCRIPLHYAVLPGYRTMFKALLARHEKANSDFLVRSRTGRTVLELAAESGHHAQVELLIERGLDVNDTWEGYSALHAAVANKHLGVIKLLLAHGGDPRRLDYYGRTPFDLASTDNSMLNILRECCDIVYTRTDPEIRLLTLKESVVRFATRALNGETSDLYKLAKCLVYLRDGDSALVVFRRAARIEASEDDLRYPMSCSGCRKRLKGGGRPDIMVLVCRRCHDLDQCDFSDGAPFLGFYSSDAGFAVAAGVLTDRLFSDEMWKSELEELIVAYS